MLGKHLILFCCSLILCILLTEVTRKKAITKGWVAKPSKDRWHKDNTALFGGIAITLSLLPNWVLASIFTAHIPFESFTANTTSHSNPTLFFLSGVVILFIMGLVDDFRGVRPHMKLFLQIVAAILVILSGHRLHWFSFQLVDSILTVLWIVMITNAFNLIDNMDGLCIGVSLIASLHFLLWMYVALPQTAFLASALAGTCVGFLLFNFNPAKIFMGDCGSHVLGYSLSVLAIYFSENISDSLLVSVSGPLLILIIPVFDTIFVTINRIREGRSIVIGGCDHTSHRLVSLGFSEKSAVLLLYAIAFIAGLTVTLIAVSSLEIGSLIVFSYTVLCCFFGWLLANKMKRSD